MILNIIKKYNKFIKYCLIGASGVALDFVIFIFLTKFAGIHYQFANMISVSCGITNNFILNAFLNFKVNNKIFLRFIKFYCVGLSGLIISSFLLHIFVELIHLNIIMSKISIMFITTLYQFTMNKRYSFKESPEYV